MYRLVEHKKIEAKCSFDKRPCVTEFIDPILNGRVFFFCVRLKTTCIDRRRRRTATKEANVAPQFERLRAHCATYFLIYLFLYWRPFA